MTDEQFKQLMEKLDAIQQEMKKAGKRDVRVVLEVDAVRDFRVRAVSKSSDWRLSC